MGKYQFDSLKCMLQILISNHQSAAAMDILKMLEPRMTKDQYIEADELWKKLINQYY